uniref:Uncharacterized protein n=1 Tax=Trypanosoma congolense (strain IL3000) TaxID=1068625 RepID=G0UV73_TRYCI|nr:conserved hypothetical protein [Trypanosoma congolense IL3000]
MNSCGTPSTFYRPSQRRNVNQHHLPPLLPSSSLRSEVFPVPPSCSITSPGVNNPIELTRRGDSAQNRCSVSTASTGTDVAHHSSGADKREDVVSYAIKHQLPLLLNNMIKDLLTERPEGDVDGWILRWFENACEKQRKRGCYWGTQFTSDTAELAKEQQHLPPPKSHKTSDSQLSCVNSRVLTQLPKMLSPMLSDSPSPTIVVSLPQCRTSFERVPEHKPEVPVPSLCTVALHPTGECEANLPCLESPTSAFATLSSSSGVSVVPVSVPPRPLQQTNERRTQRTSDEKEQQQIGVTRLPRSVDYRLKVRPSQYLELNGGDGAAPKAM